MDFGSSLKLASDICRSVSMRELCNNILSSHNDFAVDMLLRFFRHQPRRRLDGLDDGISLALGFYLLIHLRLTTNGQCNGLR